MINKQKKKLLITGASGYLGKYLVDYFKNRFKISKLTLTSNLKNSFQVDISNKKEVDTIIKKIQPDIVIHAAGINNLSFCEKNPEIAQKVNSDGTKNLAEALSIFYPKSKFVYISSDYVFNGKQGNYQEKDTTTPKTMYGKTKLLAENKVKERLENYIICRTAQVFGKGGSFFSFLFENLIHDKTIEVYEDAYFTPTYFKYFVISLLKLLEIDYIGTIHIAGKERLSRYQFAKKVATSLGKSRSLLKPALRQDRELIAKDVSLNTEKIRKLIGDLSPSIDQALKYCYKDIYKI